MLAALFYVLGGLSLIGGAIWIFNALQSAAGGGNGAALAALLISSPGFGLLAIGLIMLAIGGVLHRLERIDRNTGDAAASLRELADR